MRRWFESVTLGGGGPGGALLRPPLRLASWFYGLVIAVRNAWYDRGHVQHVDAPVIAIGNLTTGGTGKTPMAIHVVQRLRALGLRPAVVSRGYGAAGGPADELLLIQHAEPGVPCIANADRVRGASAALQRHEVDVVVLDDAFQHRRIARDLDLVLIDATAPFGGDYLLPRGRLREPLESLRRASALIITRADMVGADELSRLRGVLARVAPGKPLLSCTHRPAALTPLRAGLPRVEGGAVLLASGIAHPQAFAATARAVGLAVVDHVLFPDHHRYAGQDAERIVAQAQARRAARVVVTEKDAVKLAPLDFNWPLPVQVLPVRVDFSPADATMLDDLLRSATGRAAGERSGMEKIHQRP